MSLGSAPSLMPAGPQAPLFSPHNSVGVVVQAMRQCPDARLGRLMSAVIRHLHELVREVEPTTEEWASAIAFLTETGQRCTEQRQEFILLSDVLGVSMLVDAVNHAQRSAAATSSTILGPFYRAGGPDRRVGDELQNLARGPRLVVSGRVLDPTGMPVADACVEVWQADAEGRYDVQSSEPVPEPDLRGRLHTDSQGRYWFRSVRPSDYPIPHDGPVGRLLTSLGRHPYRPAHLHFVVSAPGYQSLTTQVFFADSAVLDSDAVFGVKESLVATPQQIDDPDQASIWKVSAPFELLEWDFVIEPRA